MAMREVSRREAVARAGSLAGAARDAQGAERADAEAYRELRTNLRFDPRIGDGAGGRAYLLADGGGVGDHAAVVANLGVACALAGERSFLWMPICAARRCR